MSQINDAFGRPLFEAMRGTPPPTWEKTCLKLSEEKRELQESIKNMKLELERIARIAHNGGLVSLSDLDAWTIVRRITTPYWSPSEKNERHRILLTEEMSNHIKECKKALKAKP